MVKPKAKRSAPKQSGAKSAGPAEANSAPAGEGIGSGAAEPGHPGAGNADGNGHLANDSPIAEGQLAQARPAIGSIKSLSGVDLTEKIKELVRLAQEQGYLTYNDINDALPDAIVSSEDLDEIYIKLRNLEVQIVDQAEVDRVKQAEPEEEEDKSRLDILDDPVRMYLKQMGQVPLLTREQEVEISKRIEDAENEVKKIIYGFGFAGKEHIALAEKLISEPPKERFDRVILDKKIESRDNHLRALRKLVTDLRIIDQQVDDQYAEWQHCGQKGKKDKCFK